MIHVESIYLNILGTEWIIIIFVALVLILGTNKLPAAARKMGKAAAEFEKAKNDIQAQMKKTSGSMMRMSGPVKDERQKLEAMARFMDIDPTKMSTDELRKVIQDQIGSEKS